MQFPVGKVGFSVGNCIFLWKSYYNYESSMLQNQDKHYEIKKQETSFSYTLSQLYKCNILIQCLQNNYKSPYPNKNFYPSNRKKKGNLRFFPQLLIVLL